MGHHELAVVKHVVADQPVKEAGQPVAKEATRHARQAFELGQRVGQPMRDLDVLAPQHLEQLHVVVAGDAEGRPEADHVAHQPHHIQVARAAVHQIAEEDGLAALGVDERPIAPGLIVVRPGATRHSQAARAAPRARRQQPCTSPMMSNGPCSSRRSFQRGTRSTVAASTCFRRVEDKNVAESLFPERPQRPPQLRLLVAHDVRAEVTCGPIAVPLVAEPLRQVEHDGYRQAVVLPGELDERLASLGLHVRGIDDREPPQRQPLGGDEPQHLESLNRDRLVVLVVADHGPAGVGREDLGRLEVPARERALARSAGANQDDEAEAGDLDGHGLFSLSTLVRGSATAPSHTNVRPWASVQVGGSHLSASPRMTFSGTGRSRRLFRSRITGSGGST